MNKYIEEATVALGALPDIFVVCQSASQCTLLDNSAAINRYKRAIDQLRNLTTHLLNRATRLVYADTIKARLATEKFGAAIRSKGKELNTKADSIPPVTSKCY